METFVVRVLRPANARPEAGVQVLRGVVEHVGSGGSENFQGEQQLIDAIRATLARTAEGEEREEARHESWT
jgi:hypothetical protein